MAKRSPEHMRGYSRGYVAGAKWPDHRPPCPPDAIVGLLHCALRNLRDVADGLVSTISDDDEWAELLNPRIDTADAALEALGRWVKTGEVDATTRAFKEPQ